MDTELIKKSEEMMGVVYSVPEKTSMKESMVCAIRIIPYKLNPNIKIVAIGLHGGKAITNWAGVYGVRTPDKDIFINPFALFSFDGGENPLWNSNRYSSRRLTNVKYITSEELEEK